MAEGKVPIVHGTCVSIDSDARERVVDKGIPNFDTKHQIQDQSKWADVAHKADASNTHTVD